MRMNRKNDLSQIHYQKIAKPHMGRNLEYYLPEPDLKVQY